MLSMTEPQASVLPARRPELVIRSLGKKGKYIMKDPRAGAYFQIGEQEFFLLNQLDGSRSAEAICGAFAKHFDQTLSGEELEEFVRMAQRRGFLEQGANSKSDRLCAPPVRRQGILYWRKSLCNPDRFFTWLAPKLWFLWTRAFFIFSAGCIVLAAFIFWSNRYELGRDLAHTLGWGTGAITWLALAIVTALHESAHGLTCKRFGGEVREIGFLLLYFRPAFYCNVSDAWLFTEKVKRLWVTFAGAYCELFLWGLATVCWRVTEPSSALNYLALIVMAITGITSLFNLNPLIKLDGYYLLSDFLEIPNLRPRAFGYMGARLKSLCLRSAGERMTLSPRERRIFWTYGLLATAYSYWFLALAISWLGSSLVGRYQGWGFVLFASLLGFVFRRPLRRCLSEGTALLASIEKARHTAWRLLKLTALLAVLLAAAFSVRMELKVSGEFRILPGKNSEVRTEVEGIIAEIPVEEGQPVQQGQVLARLADRDYRSELEKIEAEIAAMRATLKLLKTGARPEEIALANVVVAKNQDRLQFAKGRLEMDAQLYESRLVSLKELQETKETLAVRQKELEEAADKLNVLLAGSRLEEIEAKEAEINRSKTQEQYLQQQLNLLVVTSPISGIVTTRHLKEKVGQSLRKGDLISVVHELDTVNAEVTVPEQEIANVTPGQRVVFKARAYPEGKFAGIVGSIAPIANRQEDQPGRRVFLVTSQIGNECQLLKSEMTGQAKIYCGKRRVIDLLTRRFARYLRVEFWSWW